MDYYDKRMVFITTLIVEGLLQRCVFAQNDCKSQRAKAATPLQNTQMFRTLIQG